MLANRWVGPKAKYWTDSQCRRLKERKVGLAQCKGACLNTEGCTAINFHKPKGKCIMRSCDMPVPKPVGNKESKFVGYHLSNGMLK